MDNLKVYLMNVGQGESSLTVFPNGKTMLVDCFVNYEEELSYIPFMESSIPDSYDEEIEALVKRIDYVVITHPDLDHIKGIDEIFKRFDVGVLCDNGYVYDNDTEDYKKYLEIRKVYKENGRYAVLRANQNYFNSDDFGGGVLSVLSPVRKDGEDINEDSVVLKVEYCKNSILFTGDSGVSVWQSKIMSAFSNVLESTILQASHHGSRSFFIDTSIENYSTDDFYVDHLKAISPKFVFISVGKDNQHDLPDKDAVKVYKKYCPKRHDGNSIDSLVCSSWFTGTCEVTFWSNSSCEMHPVKIKTCSSSPKVNLKLSCRQIRDGISSSFNSGGDFQKQDQLKFNAALLGKWGKRIDYEWMVQNNGILEDQFHKEIYTKSGQDFKDYSDYEWGRPVAYFGRHYMWCQASDENGNVASDVFIVRVGRKPEKKNYIRNLRKFLKKKR